MVFIVIISHGEARSCVSDEVDHQTAEACKKIDK